MMKKTQPTLALKAATARDHAGHPVRLELMEGDLEGGPRRRVRIRMRSRGGAVWGTIELSRREAYALSEWLDQLATEPERDG